MSVLFRTICLTCLFLLLSTQSLLANNNSSADKWVGSWAASPQNLATPKINILPKELSLLPQKIPLLAGKTLRNIVHLSIGGSAVRIRLSNTFGTEAQHIDAATVGIRSHGSAVIAGSLKTLTFGGENSISIPAGAHIFSDPVELEVADEADLAVSIHISGLAHSPSLHIITNTTSYISTHGDLSHKEETSTERFGFFNFFGLFSKRFVPFPFWAFVTGVEVLAENNTHAIITLGDSITDGDQSSLNSNARYPDALARRLLNRQYGGAKVAVLNAGIAGNRILNDGTIFGINALARLDSDVLTQTGAKWVILLEGINDIGFPQLCPICIPGSNMGKVTAKQIIAGKKQIINRVHARGLKIYGATLLPFKGAIYYSEEGEEIRQAVNRWIRSSEAFDAVIDFDLAMQDPNDPELLYSPYDSGDHLHPSDEGYQAMADSIDLSLFE